MDFKKYVGIGIGKFGIETVELVCNILVVRRVVRGVATRCA